MSNVEVLHRKTTHELTQIRISFVKLVVPQGHRVETELIQRLCDFFATVVAVEKCALELIAHVEEQRVFRGLATGIYCGLYACVSAVAATRRLGAVRTRGGDLVQVSVDIVDMVDRWSTKSEKTQSTENSGAHRY